METPQCVFSFLSRHWPRARHVQGEEGVCSLSLFLKPSPSSDAEACLLKWNPHLPHPQNEGRERDRERERETTKEEGGEADFSRAHFKKHAFSRPRGLGLEITERSVGVASTSGAAHLLPCSLAQPLIAPAAYRHHTVLN